MWPFRRKTKEERIAKLHRPRLKFTCDGVDFELTRNKFKIEMTPDMAERIHAHDDRIDTIQYLKELWDLVIVLDQRPRWCPRWLWRAYVRFRIWIRWPILPK